MAAKQADESMMVSQSKDQFSTKLKLPGQFAESRYIFPGDSDQRLFSEYLERTDTEMQTRSDDLIRNDVLFELKWDPKIGSSSDIAVGVKDGVVTLSGFVKSYWDKDAAEKAAKRVYGRASSGQRY